MDFDFKFLSIGTKIDIIRVRGDKEISYPSQVLDIVDSQELIISGPIKQNNLVFIHNGEEIDICYNVENIGKHYFIAKVLSRNNSPVYSLKVSRISEVRKIQQRNYYRLLTALSVDKEHSIIKGNDFEILVEHCETNNISGGGMKLYCNYEHKVGDEIICSLKIGDSFVRTKALVVRVEETNSFNYRFSIGISFSEIKEEDRDLIIKYIFEQQRILRLKGLI
ncbi:flagellar brake protein [Tissierella praeacuta]|uniref:flagellar brake protein n=1 Tax=Tissierella praeacuta TaxID=43131 RepID=UPI001C10CA75|nr:flagellar brake protein [Tissierella praeacuta]MBU5254775.1 flagellar brake protein [Tissierella praeacuta]